MPAKLAEISEETGCVKRYTKVDGVSITDGVQRNSIHGAYEDHHEYRQKSQPVNPSFPFYCIFCLHERKD